MNSQATNDIEAVSDKIAEKLRQPVQNDNTKDLRRFMDDIRHELLAVARRAKGEDK